MALLKVCIMPKGGEEKNHAIDPFRNIQACNLKLCDLVNYETKFSVKWLTHLVFGFDGR